MTALDQMSREELISKVKELSALLEQIRNEKDAKDITEFPWVGNLGNWYWHVKANNLVFNDLKIITLGYQRRELPEIIGYEFFTKLLHPDDYDRVMENMRSHLYGMSPVYECSYRIQKKDGTWVWYYDRGKITKRDEAGKPEIVSGIVFDISEQKKLEEALSKQNELLNEMSRTDFLTKINNRRSLYEKLEYEMLRSKRTHEPLSIAIMDIDHFKKVNDSYGHLAGDQVLIDVAKIIQSSVRITDIVGRYGGEEFMIILPNCSAVDAVNVAETIRMSVEGETFENGLKLTISGGLKQYDGETVDGVIELVDQSLYDAKQYGRNQMVLFGNSR